MELIKPQNLMLSMEQFARLLPYFIVLGGSLISLLVGVMKAPWRNAGAATVAFATPLVAILSLVQIWGEPSTVLMNGMLTSDYFSSLFSLIFLVATASVVLLAYPYLEKEKIQHAEFYSLVLMSCLGMMFLASTLDLIVLFVALEIMSIGVYVLVGFRRTDIRSNEAAVKYFVLGSAASAILLFGVSMLYGASGTMNLSEIAAQIKAGGLLGNTIFILGVVLIVAGFLFKVATVPFHMWMPDVYEGAPTVVTNFMTTGLKAAAFGSFLRVFIALGYGQEITAQFSAHLREVLWVVAILTMVVGNVVALTQRNVKRMLAYSSIAHSGYLLVGLISCGRSEYGMSSVVLYLISYVIMNIGAFAIVGLISTKGDDRINVEDFAGLGFQKPVLGFAMAVFMFSMAGVPPTAGFAGKYLIFSSAVQSGEVLLAVLSVLCSAVSAYYYLRMIVYMYMREPVHQFSTLKINFATGIVVIAMMLGTLHFGLFPSVLIHAAKKAVMNI